MVILFDKFNFPKNIFAVVFATPQQAMVAQLLVEEFKKNDGVLSRQLMSFFATKLHDGQVSISSQGNPFADMEGINFKPKQQQMSYNKKQFYDRILTPMRTMGMVDFDMYKRIYILSGDFDRILQEIGKMWKKESHK